MAWIYDLIFLALFAYAAASSWRKGFLAGLTELIGAVLGVGVAVWASRTLAGPLSARSLSGTASDGGEEAVAQSGGDLAAAVQGMDFLPDAVRDHLSVLLEGAGEALPGQISGLLEPVILPFVQVLLFVVLCMAVRWCFRLLVGLLRHVNGVPLLGGVNRLFGLLLGLCTGALDCWLLALLLWFLASVTAGSVEFLTAGVLQQSVGYSFFSALNPFLVHY